MNPWAAERAALVSKGVSLSPRGSVRDNIQREMQRRERMERVAFARMLIEALRVGPNLDVKEIPSIIGPYAEYVFHDAYRQDGQIDPRVNADKNLLAKVDQMTVTDDDAPLPPKAKKKKRR